MCDDPASKLNREYTNKKETTRRTVRERKKRGKKGRKERSNRKGKKSMGWKRGVDMRAVSRRQGKVNVPEAICVMCT